MERTTEHGHAGQVRTASILAIAIGLWLAVGAWVLRVGPEAVPEGLAVPAPADASAAGAWNVTIAGVVIAVLAAVRLVAYRTTWPSWVNVLLGLWVALSAWVFGYIGNDARVLNEAVLGLAVSALAFWSVWASNTDQTR